MKIETTIFQLYRGRYKNISELARAMGISLSQVYRVRQGKRGINQQFILGTIRAFPGYEIGELFYVRSELLSSNPANKETVAPVFEAAKVTSGCRT